MNGKEDSGSSEIASPRKRTRPAHLNDFVTDNQIIDEACKRTKGTDGPGREIFQDDIYHCIRRIFNGDDIADVTDSIQSIIGGRKIRTVLNKMDNPDAECERAKNNIPQEQDSMELKKYKNIKFRKEQIGNPIKGSPIEEIVEKYPIIKTYTGTERTSFINNHYKDKNVQVPDSVETITDMLLTTYHATDIKYCEKTEVIKSFKIDIKPETYDECGKCWLCDEMVYYYRSESARESTSCGDCEHVAGIVVGMLTGLLACQNQDLMVYGYQPSHVHCNRFKNDDITIKFEDGLWVPDEVNIDKIVDWILIDDAVHKSEYCPMLKERFRNAIREEGMTIYNRYQNDEQYHSDIVKEYKKKCEDSIMKHSELLCNKINRHYGLNNTEKSESQKMSEWVDTIASFFKQNPSLGTTSGGMDGDEGEGEGDNPGDKKRSAEKISESAPGTPEYTSTSNGPSSATPVRSRIQGPMITPGGFPTNVGQGGPGESGAIFHTEEYLTKARQTAEDIAAAAEQAADHHQLQLAGHTLNLFNAAVMLLYMNKDSSFMECMRDAGIRLRKPAETKDEGARGEEDEGYTQGEEFTQESVIEVSPPPEEYNTQQYYDNYKKLVDEFRANGGDGDGDSDSDGCVHVIYIYNPKQALRDYMNTENYKNDIQIETGSSNSGPNDCFETIVERVLCSRHQQKIDEGDTQLHLYVPTINDLQVDDKKEGGVPGGMLKKPKQRKTRKHNQKKKKRTIRKNKQQQQTKRSKRTFKKKSHKNSKKKSHKSQ